MPNSTFRDQGHRNSGHGPHSTLFSGVHENVNPASPSCCYCQQKHSTKDCTSVTGVRERKQILQNGVDVSIAYARVMLRVPVDLLASICSARGGTTPLSASQCSRDPVLPPQCLGLFQAVTTEYKQ